MAIVVVVVFVTFSVGLVFVYILLAKYGYFRIIHVRTKEDYVHFNGANASVSICLGWFRLIAFVLFFSIRGVQV